MHVYMLTHETTVLTEVVIGLVLRTFNHALVVLQLHLGMLHQNLSTPTHTVLQAVTVEVVALAAAVEQLVAVEMDNGVMESTSLGLPMLVSNASSLV